MIITLKELCKQFTFEYQGQDDLIITHACSLDDLQPGGIAYYTANTIAINDCYSENVLIVPKNFENSSLTNLIFTDDPLALHAKITLFLHHPPRLPEVKNPTAVVGKNVQIGENVQIGAHVVIYDDVKIGDNVTVHAGTVIMANSIIGDNTFIYPNVTIYHNTIVGSRVILHAGSAIGSDGFGYFERDDQQYKIPQIGNVIIEDDVEIGANCTIDRARFTNTIIHRGTKLDNLVHIAHNVEVGENSLITGQCGIAGSTKIGNNLKMGGQSGFIGHLKVGEYVTLMAKSLATSNVDHHSNVAGIPARDNKNWKTAQANLYRLQKMNQKIKDLEKELQNIKKIQ